MTVIATGPRFQPVYRQMLRNSFVELTPCFFYQTSDTDAGMTHEPAIILSFQPSCLRLQESWRYPLDLLRIPRNIFFQSRTGFMS